MLLAHGDGRRQARAALLTVANPVLIWAVVAGAHNEALSVMFAVAGMLFMRKNPFVAGIGIGLAGCAKLSIGLWGLAMLWAYRREPKKALLLCAGTAIPMGLAYVVWQPSAFFQVLRNGGYVSVGSWAHPFYQFFNLFLTPTNAKIVVGVISYAGLVVIAWMLSRTVPWTAVPGLAKGADLRQDPLTIALRTALVLSVAWLITSMYTLSWYDLIAWVPLAVLATNKLDRIMLLRAARCLWRTCRAGPSSTGRRWTSRLRGSGTRSRRSSSSRCCWPSCCGGGSRTGRSSSRSAATRPRTAPEPAAPPATTRRAVRPVRRATAGLPTRAKVTTHRPPAPARSGSRRR